MSTQPARGVKSEGINDDTVAQYLQTYPDFFERNSALLARLRLPHARNSGQTISLVERQVDVRGGRLIVSWAGNGERIWLTGPTETAYEGRVEV